MILTLYIEDSDLIIIDNIAQVSGLQVLGAGYQLEYGFKDRI